jgi:ribonuclease Z
VKPLFHPRLVNGPFDDPALYVEFMFERRALMFDLGDIAALSNRRLLRLSHIFVSHAHMDHFMGLDRLVRVCLGRDVRLHLFGPAGLVGQTEHKLRGYTWNLVENYANDFTLCVTEAFDEVSGHYAEFPSRDAFRRRGDRAVRFAEHTLVDEEQFQVRFAIVDHGTPCLAFALEEKRHLNVWKNRLEALGLETGPWLRELKQAVLRGEPDDYLIEVSRREGTAGGEPQLPLKELRRQILRESPGQKLGYVVDSAYHPDNAARIVALVQGADQLFIETAFLEADAALAAQKRHLTAHQAGELAARAAVHEVSPLHFSRRYEGRETELRHELQTAFAGRWDGLEGQ